MTAIFTFVRHSQKKSGLVFEKDTSNVSSSDISEQGKIRAEQFGSNHLKGRSISQAYATSSNRTKETLLTAFQAAGVTVPIQIDGLYTLPISIESEETANEYNRIFMSNLNKSMKQFFPKKIFEGLSADQQETIAENAEEDAIEWLLSLSSAKRQANSVAYKLQQLIKSATETSAHTDIISCGHKTSTEAFLKYCIGFSSLKEIGGSLKILDSWTLTIDNSITLTTQREQGTSQS